MTDFRRLLEALVTERVRAAGRSKDLADLEAIREIKKRNPVN